MFKKQKQKPKPVPKPELTESEVREKERRLRKLDAWGAPVEALETQTVWIHRSAPGIKTRTDVALRKAFNKLFPVRPHWKKK